jgi:hypothetical protein
MIRPIAHVSSTPISPVQTPCGIDANDGTPYSELKIFQTAPTAVCRASKICRIQRRLFIGHFLIFWTSLAPVVYFGRRSQGMMINLAGRVDVTPTWLLCFSAREAIAEIATLGAVQFRVVWSTSYQ